MTRISLWSVAARLLVRMLLPVEGKPLVVIYKAAAEYAATRGIIIADTKFEFGLSTENLHLLMSAFYTRFKPFLAC